MASAHNRPRTPGLVTVYGRRCPDVNVPRLSWRCHSSPTSGLVAGWPAALVLTASGCELQKLFPAAEW